MKFLVDNALSPVVARLLAEAGHDAVHVRQLEMQASPDEKVFEIAEEEERIIVSSDTDFGALLAVRRKRRPSFILLRKTRGLRPEKVASQLLHLSRAYADELHAGCVLKVSDRTVRLRLLPI